VALTVELTHVPVAETAGIQDIRVIDINGSSRRVGFVPADDGASVRFVRIPNDEAQRAEIVAEVTRLRSEMGLTTDSRSSVPPNPAEIKAALKKDKR